MIKKIKRSTPPPGVLRQLRIARQHRVIRVSLRVCLYVSVSLLHNSKIMKPSGLKKLGIWVNLNTPFEDN